MVVVVVVLLYCCLDTRICWFWDLVLVSLSQQQLLSYVAAVSIQKETNKEKIRTISKDTQKHTHTHTVQTHNNIII